MQPRPSFDRTRLILIAVDVVAILVIGWVFLTSALGKSLLPATATPSSVSSREAGTLAPPPSAARTRHEASPAATGANPEAFPETPVETLTATLMVENLPTPPAAPTAEQIPPLRAGKYDDMDPSITYDRFWTVLKNPGTKNAYKGAIHASNAIGNEASFRFTGERFQLGYQRGRNFGTVKVLIDDQPYSFHEQAFDLVWRSPQLAPGDHFVRIIHDSGQTVTLDYIVILD